MKQAVSVAHYKPAASFLDSTKVFMTHNPPSIAQLMHSNAAGSIDDLSLFVGKNRGHWIARNASDQQPTLIR